MREKVAKMIFADVYPLYVQKAERKGRAREEVDEVIRWLTGYTAEGLREQIEARSCFEEFFASAPCINPKAELITGTICGCRIETIEDALMKQVRWLDKLVDELAKGRAMQRILRE